MCSAASFRPEVEAFGLTHIDAGLDWSMSDQATWGVFPPMPRSTPTSPTAPSAAPPSGSPAPLGAATALPARSAPRCTRCSPEPSYGARARAFQAEMRELPGPGHMVELLEAPLED